MDSNELLTGYNYDSFIPENFEQWMRFEQSPKLGNAAPDFPLTRLDKSSVLLSEIWSTQAFTVVEFGSFT